MKKDLDPNETLTQIRGAISAIDLLGYSGGQQYDNLTASLVPHLKDLDRWLVEGGRMPEVWNWETTEAEPVKEVPPPGWIVADYNHYRGGWEIDWDGTHYINQEDAMVAVSSAREAGYDARLVRLVLEDDSDE